MEKTLKVKKKSGVITLSDKDYKASGGQGVVYCKDKLAYKIYHNPKQMIPVAKIQELSTLNNPSILGPIEALYNPADDTPIGFTMSYVSKTEFLCKVFTKNFRDDNSLTPQDIVAMVTSMQKTLEYIHAQKFLVVDYNELNFLLSKDMKTVYHIDVDSWKTPSFPAMALMESVRDRKYSKGTFNELTDWFSFAVVTFQMYVGIHPYKGFHPKYGPGEWSKRMDLGLSVFEKGVTLPPACQDLSVIPKRHFDWYKEIFVKNDRSVPPYADTVTVAVSGRFVSSKGQFMVELVHEYKSPIKKVYFFDDKRYVITNDGIFRDDIAIAAITGISDRSVVELTAVYGEEPVLAWFNQGIVTFYTLNHTKLGDIPAEACMSYNGVIYTIYNGDLIENSFERLGKLIHRTNVISSVCPSYRSFPGIIVQDDFMRCHLAIPYEKKLCANVHVKELDGQRIIDARHSGQVSVLIVEKQGVYWRHTLCFNKTFSSYFLSTDQIDHLQDINLVALPNGLNLLADDTKVVLFKDMSNKKEMTGTPVDSSTRLCNNGMSVHFTDGNKLYECTVYKIKSK